MRTALARRRFLQVCAGALAAAGCTSGEEPVDASRSGLPIPSHAGGSVGQNRVAYGEHDDAFADLWLPAVTAEPVPVVVLVHGGFWRDQYRLDLMDGLAASVADAGWAAWNIEYRRVGAGGGHPETFDDVDAAVERLASVDAPLDLERVAIVGHSAGGHLAVWAASRPALAPGTAWSDPGVRPLLAVSQAGVLDLAECAVRGTGGSACPDLLGGTPVEVPDRYARASPIQLVPASATVVAVHGTDDDIVPLAQSERYVAAAEAAGGQATLRTVEGADHFAMIDPTHEAWRIVLDELRAAFAP